MDWIIPVTWQMAGTVSVKANTLEDALNMVRNNEDIPLPSGYYVESSFEPSFDNPEEIRELYNAGQPDICASEMFVFDDEIMFCQDAHWEEADGYLWATDVLVERMKDIIRAEHTENEIQSLGSPNFYSIYNVRAKSASIIGTYLYRKDEEWKQGEFSLKLSAEEEKNLIEKMEAHCQERHHIGILEQINIFRKEDGLPEIPVTPQAIDSVMGVDLEKQIRSASNRAADSASTDKAPSQNPFHER